MTGPFGRRRTRDELTILGCLVAGDIYPYSMSLRSGLGSGRVYPALDRLERKGLVWGAFCEQISGPARRRYGLTVRATRFLHLQQEAQERLGAMTDEDRQILEREEQRRGLYERIDAQVDAMLEGLQ